MSSAPDIGRVRYARNGSALCVLGRRKSRPRLQYAARQRVELGVAARPANRTICDATLAPDRELHDKRSAILSATVIGVGRRAADQLWRRDRLGLRRKRYRDLRF